MDPNLKQSIIDRLKQTNNVLVTVKSSPTVDQLAACIGLTLFLNKQGKHATAVFSGEVPSTIEFLKPEDTLEKDTNSLRDFIIALDKSKADKLRYKVEDKVVKIFITPYRTSLSQSDLDFSQGDFNVDVVIALGVHSREELDQAIVAHGKILHDATIISINNGKTADLGVLNWADEKASSISEMISGLADSMQANAMDAQMATAFLTGIVAETDRFSNTKTTSATMSLSAKLMAAGANQQLVASKLQEGRGTPVKSNAPKDDTLEISHGGDGVGLPAVDDAAAEEIHIDDSGNLKGLNDAKAQPKPNEPNKLIMEPPSMGGTLTANGKPPETPPNVDPLSDSFKPAPLSQPAAELPEVKPPSETPHKGVDLSPAQTLSAIEAEVDSPHVSPEPVLDEKNLRDVLKDSSSGDSVNPNDLPATGIDDARKAVEAAAAASAAADNEPMQALNSQPLGPDLNQPIAPLPGNAPNPADIPLPAPNQGGSVDNFGLPPNLVPPNQPLPPEQTGTDQPPTPPPPVPPPMMPPTM
jgi:nanoRNase/pAp phosphatase (c-di-AMP/oligoRNAs hydrolase)